MLFANVLLGIAAAILLIGVIAEQDKQKEKNITIAFVAVCVLIFALNKIL